MGQVASGRSRPCRGRGSGLAESGDIVLCRPLLASRWEVRAQYELAVETAGLETAVCLRDLIEADPLGDARPDGASRQQAEEPLQNPPGTTRDVAPASH